MNEVLIMSPVYNEKETIGSFIDKLKFVSNNNGYDFILIDDCSDDGSENVLKEKGVNYIKHYKRQGVGKGIIDAIDYGKEKGYKILVVMASNGKDKPAEIPRLVHAIQDYNYDFIQGSRYLKGGSTKGTPWQRKLSTKIFTLGWNLITWYWMKDASNGFRAYKFSIFNDENINYHQTWLYKYSLEYYLLFKVFKLKYGVKEVPVSKEYPRKKKYTHIVPVIDWAKMGWTIISLRMGWRK